MDQYPCPQANARLQHRHGQISPLSVCRIVRVWIEVTFRSRSIVWPQICSDFLKGEFDALCIGIVALVDRTQGTVLMYRPSSARMAHAPVVVDVLFKCEDVYFFRRLCMYFKVVT